MSSLSARLLGFTLAQADQMAALARAVDMTRAGVSLRGIVSGCVTRRTVDPEFWRLIERRLNEAAQQWTEEAR